MKHAIVAIGFTLLALGSLLLFGPLGRPAVAQAPEKLPAPDTTSASPAAVPPAEPISTTAATATYQLLTNPSVEVYDPPYTQFHGVDCQVASGWQRFWDTGRPEPYWMDCDVFAHSSLGGGWTEAIDGATSQLVLSTEPYTAGLLQTVTGLTPGLGYGFHAAMLTIYQSSAAPDVDGTMIKQVGMDPTGGTDPDAASVVWSEADGNDKGPWSIDLRTAVFAQSTAMTVFIRVDSPYPAGDWPYLNLSFLDSAILALTPVVTATSPALSQEATFDVEWNNAVAAPGAVKLRWYDVQWLDEAEGVWHNWFVRTDRVGATFTGDQGHAYRFRARVWQKYENGAHLYGPYRPEGDTRTLVAGSRLVGRVLTPEGYPVAGATVAISGTTHAALSDAAGWYQAVVPSWTDPRSLTVAHPHWLSPPPVHGVTLAPTQTLTTTWTLRPPTDAIAGGQFEAGLQGWSPLETGPAPAVVGDPVHTGHYALALGDDLEAGQTSGLTQTLVLTHAWDPALSFWYRPAVPDPDDARLRVILTVVTQPLTTTLPPTRTVPVSTTTYIYTPDLAASGWQHLWYPVGPPQTYLSATVTVLFDFSRLGDDDDPIAVYLDEVSLGDTPGGPWRGYLPLVLRQYATPLSNSGFSPIYDRIGKESFP